MYEICCLFQIQQILLHVVIFSFYWKQKNQKDVVCYFFLCTEEERIVLGERNDHLATRDQIHPRFLHHFKKQDRFASFETVFRDIRTVPYNFKLHQQLSKQYIKNILAAIQLKLIWLYYRNASLKAIYTPFFQFWKEFSTKFSLLLLFHCGYGKVLILVFGVK